MWVCCVCNVYTKYFVKTITVIGEAQCTVDSYWGSPIHLPVTPAWPVTSETGPLPLDYSMCCQLV